MVTAQTSDPLAQALTLMTATPTAIAALVRAAPADVLERRASAEEWSPREVLAHLLYVEGLLRARLEAMADGGPMPAGKPAPEPGLPLPSLASWRRRRAANLRWLRSLDAAQLERS